MAVTRSTLRLQRELDAAVTAVLDTHTREATAAWVAAWDEVAVALGPLLVDILTQHPNGVTGAQMRRDRRLQQILRAAAVKLGLLSEQSRDRIVADLAAVVAASAAAQGDIIGSQLPADGLQVLGLEEWPQADQRQLDAIVQRVAEQVTSAHQALSAAASAVLGQELVRGVAAGLNPRSVAARIMARVEGAFNGGLTRALIIARTEICDAYRVASAAAQAANARVLDGWVWVAALSNRTCPSCITMHGTVHPLSEAGPNDHQQGRCTRVPKVKAWSSLGIATPEPESVLQDAAAWFDSLSSRDQLAILGRARWDAWRRGDYPMSRWSQVRHTDGWRDSYVPSPPPASATQAAA